MLTPWLPTHLIEFTPDNGRAPTLLHVMLMPPRDTAWSPAYTRAEWMNQATASANNLPFWGLSEAGEWKCQGQSTPGGRPGTLKVQQLTPKQAQEAALTAAYEEAAALEPEDGEEMLEGTTPNARTWKATRRALARLWALWRLLAARAGRTGEGLELLTEDGTSVWISTVGSPRHRMAVVCIRQNGAVQWFREAEANAEEQVAAEPWEQS